MNEPTIKDGVLSYPIWVKMGFGMYNRDCLDYDHPEQTYNYLKRHGITPEHYNIQHPRITEMMRLYAGKSREQLIIENMELREEILAMQKAGF